MRFIRRRGDLCGALTQIGMATFKLGQLFACRIAINGGKSSASPKGFQLAAHLLDTLAKARVSLCARHGECRESAVSGLMVYPLRHRVLVSAVPLRYELARPMIDCNLGADHNDGDGEEHAREVARQRAAATRERVLDHRHGIEPRPAGIGR